MKMPGRGFTSIHHGGIIHYAFIFSVMDPKENKEECKIRVKKTKLAKKLKFFEYFRIFSIFSKCGR